MGCDTGGQDGNDNGSVYIGEGEDAKRWRREILPKLRREADRMERNSRPRSKREESSMTSKLTPREWNRITDMVLDLSGRAQVAVARAKVERAKRELVNAREELNQARMRYTTRGRVLIKPRGKPSVPIKKIKEVVRKHK